VAQGAQARCGNSAHPAASRIAASEISHARKMWVVILEMGVALALLV
jgi:hypothetical protein